MSDLHYRLNLNRLILKPGLPMAYSSVLIVTYGRSGSTLMQGVLNSIDGCLIRGENYNLCYGLFTAYESVCRARRKSRSGARSGEVTSPWYGADQLDAERFLEDARTLVIRQLNPARQLFSLIGFKEIRYLNSDLMVAKGSTRPRLHDYLDFLAKLFPEPAFVALTRDHEAVVRSGWWQQADKPLLLTRLGEFESAVTQYAQSRDNVFRISYEEVTGTPARLQDLFRFLGAAYDPDRVEQVLATKHSYTEKPASGPGGKRRGSKRLPSPAGRAPTAFRQQPARVIDIDSGLVEHVRLDPLPAGAKHSAPARISGVVLLAGNIEHESLELLVVCGNTEQAFEWRLPSPGIAKKFPGNGNASHARFESACLVSLTPGQPAELHAVDSAGLRRLLFRIDAAGARARDGQ